MRVDGLLEKDKKKKRKRIKTVEIWFLSGGGAGVGKRVGDEDDEDERTQSKLVRRSPHSVLLLFTAPGSFSCNLREREKRVKKER